jgi:hypothetical protein
MGSDNLISDVKGIFFNSLAGKEKNRKGNEFPASISGKIPSF